MRRFVTAATIPLVAAGIVGLVVTVASVVPSARAGYGNQVTTTDFDDGWDTGGRRKCRKNKRKCVEIASNIAYGMAQSGAYADLNDDEFAQLATRIAAHIVDSRYDHDETSPLDP